MKSDMPKVGIGVVLLNQNNEVLLILRNSDAKKADSDMHLEGTWTLPAGKVKYGETIINAGIRKVKEEVNLNIYDIKVISVSDDINSYAHFLTVGLLAKKYDGIIDLGTTEEHVDYSFFKLDDLPNNLCELSKIIIENYIQNKIYQGR